MISSVMAKTTTILDPAQSALTSRPWNRTCTQWDSKKASNRARKKAFNAASTKATLGVRKIGRMRMCFFRFFLLLCLGSKDEHSSLHFNARLHRCVGFGESFNATVSSEMRRVLMSHVLFANSSEESVANMVRAAAGSVPALSPVAAESSEARNEPVVLPPPPTGSSVSSVSRIGDVDQSDRYVEGCCGGSGSTGECCGGSHEHT